MVKYREQNGDKKQRVSLKTFTDVRYNLQADMTNIALIKKSFLLSNLIRVYSSFLDGGLSPEETVL